VAKGMVAIFMLKTPAVHNPQTYNLQIGKPSIDKDPFSVSTLYARFSQVGRQAGRQTDRWTDG
jgi:hypothetical protein